jgi:hypothetical protein
MEPENVLFLSICSLYTGYNYMRYSLMGKIRLSFIDSDLLYKIQPFMSIYHLYTG